MTSLRFAPRLRPLFGVIAALAGAALVVSACGSNTTTGGPTATGTQSGTGTASSTGTSSPTTPSSSSKPAAPKPKPVHVSLKFGDGAQVGVGMPIMAFLSRPIKDAKAFAKATKVTVNDNPVAGGWYFEPKYQDPGHPVEADYRLQAYWPAHAHIHMDLPVKGLSAGPGLAFDNSITLDFATGPANILTVDDSTHQVTVLSDGKPWGTFRTSLGASDTPTKRGTKVIMEKGNSICMRGPGYYECGVRYTQRLTYDGEYLHAAPWNTANIARGVDSSNGCTNLDTGDAQRLYGFLEVGDVVKYANANGPRMQLGDGYGDWNLTWSQWKTGGLYPVA